MKDTPFGDVRCDDILSWRNGKRVTEELESMARDTKFLLPFDFDQFPNSHLILEKWRARSWAFTRSEKKKSRTILTVAKDIPEILFNNALGL